MIAQLAYNRVLSRPDVPRRKVSYNNTHFPLYQKTDLQPLTDNSTNIAVSATTRRQRSCSAAALQVDRQLAVLPAAVRSAAATSSRRGFDNGYTPEDVTRSASDNVNLAFTQPADAGRERRVTIFNTPAASATAP